VSLYFPCVYYPIVVQFLAVKTVAPSCAWGLPRSPRLCPLVDMPKGAFWDFTKVEPCNKTDKTYKLKMLGNVVTPQFAANRVKAWLS